MFFKIKNLIYKGFKTTLSVIKIKMKQLEKRPVLQVLIFSIVLVFILEMLSRRSMIKGLGFVIDNPLMFIFNVLIILVTLSVTMMFSRKKFLLALITTIWLTLGVTNFVMLGYRTTPLTAIEFYIFKSVFGIIHIYLNIFQIILIIVIFAIVLIGIIILWKKLPKCKAQFRVPFIMLCLTTVLMVTVSFISFKVNALSNNFGNLAEAFSEYGFAYCFSSSIFDQGINEPDDYSEENIDAVLEIIASDEIDKNNEGLNESDSKVPQTNNVQERPIQPNVIMIQLESFFDVNHLLDFTFSENPTPNFTQLKKAYSYGYLTVPSIGAGTANTEFEIITGMNIQHFGAGEYPYKTILQSTTCESIAYNLGELGYHSHAIHNNTGTFYDRNSVFQKLGFDSYSSIEYMNNVEYNPLGWAKDNILQTEILKALEARASKDLIYAISVQPHGKYPNTIVDENQKITVDVDPGKRQLYDNNNIEDDMDLKSKDEGTVAEGNGAKETGTEETETEKAGTEETGTQTDTEEISFDERYKNGFEYFVNQLAETDQFIGDLINELSLYDEPTVVVFYGDHLPSMSIEDVDLSNNNKFQTEYILWSNFKMEQVKRDLNAYQLNAYVMERLGYDNGILTKFHQRYIGKPDYQVELEVLQYDMLYGDRNVFNGENPYEEQTIQMGVFEVRIKNVIEKGEVTFIEGENFTPWSVVYIDKEPKETLFIDENTLIVPEVALPDDGIYVAQVSDNKTILSQSKEWQLVKKINKSKSPLQ